MLITRIYTRADVTFDRYLLKYMGDNTATAGGDPGGQNCPVLLLLRRRRHGRGWGCGSRQKESRHSPFFRLRGRVHGADDDLPAHAARHTRIAHGRANHGCFPPSQLLPITTRTTRCFPPLPSPWQAMSRAARLVLGGPRHASRGHAGWVGCEVLTSCLGG